MSLVTLNLTKDEETNHLEIMLGEIHNRILAHQPPSGTETLDKPLATIVRTATQYSGKRGQQGEQVLFHVNLLPLFDLLSNEGARLDLAKEVLLGRGHDTLTDDHVDAYLHLCTILAGSVDPLTIAGWKPDVLAAQHHSVLDG